MKTLIRHVQKGQASPVTASLVALAIEGEWVQTSGPKPELFLIYDNGQESYSRIIVFTSPPVLHTLSTADTWFMDGFTTVDVAYTLLQRKTHDTYEELLHALLDKCSSKELYPNPGTILVDFDQAVISAIGKNLEQ